MKKVNLKGVSVGTWARTIVLVIALVSQFLVLIGKRSESIDIDAWTQYATYILTVIASAWAWWKNNSITRNAQEADKFLKGEDYNVNHK